MVASTCMYQNTTRGLQRYREQYLFEDFRCSYDSVSTYEIEGTIFEETRPPIFENEMDSYDHRNLLLVHLAGSFVN